MILRCLVAEVLQRSEGPRADLDLVKDDEGLVGLDGLSAEQAKVADNPPRIQIPCEQIAETRVLLEVDRDGVGVLLLSRLLEAVELT